MADLTSRLDPKHDQAEVLTSWKEIAGYFGISVRTAQLWEEERGLVVYRLPGTKGRVYAIVPELEIWRQKILLGGEAPIRRRLAADRPTPARRASRWALALSLLSIALCSSIAFYAWWSFSGRSPHSWELRGNLLHVRDESGRLLWSYPFESPPEAGLNDDALSDALLEDLDGDGRPELLFPFRNSGPGTSDDYLICFSSKGEVLWQRAAGHTIRSASEEFHPPFRIRLLAVVPVPGSHRRNIVYTASHKLSYPTVVALRDSKGELLREYWHSGAIDSLLVADLDEDKRPEIYLAGVARCHHRADIVRLDPENFSGASMEIDPACELTGLPPAEGQLRLLFGRTLLNQTLDRYNVARSLRREGSELTVRVVEGEGSGNPGSLFYHLTPRLRITEVVADEGLKSSYRRLHDSKLLPSDFTSSELDRLREPSAPPSPAPAPPK